jgi:hypothetical protein
MAGFLNRGLGRGAHDTGITSGDDWATVLPASDTAIPAVDLTIGGGSGGTQYVTVSGNVQAFTNQVGLCPCELEIFLLSDSGEVSESATTVFAVPSAGRRQLHRGIGLVVAPLHGAVKHGRDVFPRRSGHADAGAACTEHLGGELEPAGHGRAVRRHGCEPAVPGRHVHDGPALRPGAVQGDEPQVTRALACSEARRQISRS